MLLKHLHSYFVYSQIWLNLLVENGHFGYLKNLKKQKKILEWWWFAGSTGSGTNSLQKAKM
jgi:hypothetical protein